MSRARALGRALLVAAVACLAAAGSLAAHGALRASRPATGAVLDTVPRVLRLTFTEPVELAVATLALTGADGRAVPLSPLRLAPDSAQVLVADVVGAVAAGRYTVAWQVAGRDGHPVRGQFRFTVAASAQGTADAGAPAAPPAPSPADRVGDREPPTDQVGPASAGAPAERPAFDAGSPLYAGIRWAGLLALVPLVGVVAFRWLVLRPLGTAAAGAHAALAAAAEVPARAMGLALGAVVAASLLARLAAQAVAMFGVGGALDIGRVAGLLTGTGWGAGWLLQAVGLALVVGALALARRSDGARGWPLAAVAVAVIAVGSALSGHAAAQPLAAVAVASDALHLLAAAGWLGTLFVVLVAGLPAAYRLGEAERLRGGAALVRRFSRAALACAAVVVVTGVVNGWLELRELGALWSTAYGRTLLVKLALLLPVALLGAYNWRRVVPAIEAEGGAARLRRTATVELVFGAFVLLATAVLVATPTPLE